MKSGFVFLTWTTLVILMAFRNLRCYHDWTATCAAAGQRGQGPPSRTRLAGASFLFRRLTSRPNHGSVHTLKYPRTSSRRKPAQWYVGDGSGNLLSADGGTQPLRQLWPDPKSSAGEFAKVE
jgi:hypothetical protein